MELLKDNVHNTEYEEFSNIFSEFLDKHFPKKWKDILANQSGFMNKKP